MITSPSHLLAIHAIGHSAVPRNGIAKILDVKSTLEARCEEASKRSDKRGEDSHNGCVNLERRPVESSDRPLRGRVSSTSLNMYACLTTVESILLMFSGMVWDRQTKTSLGLQTTPEKAVEPRSKAGQIIKL